MTKSIFFTLSTAILLSACTKDTPTSFAELDSITDQTMTSMEERTPHWFSNQDQVRKLVLAACFDHLTLKAETLGGAYQAEFNDDVFGKFNEYPDCANARKGDIENMSKGALVYEHQIKDAEYLLNTPENKEHIDAVARDVANKLQKLNEDNKEINEAGLKEMSNFDNSNNSD